MRTFEDVLADHEKSLIEYFGEDHDSNVGWSIDEVQGVIVSKVYSAGVYFVTEYDPLRFEIRVEYEQE